MVHLLQNYNFGTLILVKLIKIWNNIFTVIGESFNYFDYGPAKNLERYGTVDPPEYNLTRVTAPVYLVHADSDPFAPPEVCKSSVQYLLAFGEVTSSLYIYIYI